MLSTYTIGLSTYIWVFHHELKSAHILACHKYLLPLQQTKTMEAGTQFIGVKPGINMQERKSNVANNPTDVFTIEEIGAAANSYIDITYAELYQKLSSSTLVTGEKYRLTDYKYVNWLSGQNNAENNISYEGYSYNPREIYTSDPEVLLLEVTSPSSLSPIAYSESHTSDIIEYLPYKNNIGLSMSLYNGCSLPNDLILEEFDLQFDGTNWYFDMPYGYPALTGQYFYVYAEFDDGNIDLEWTILPTGTSYPNYADYSGSGAYITLENNNTRVVINGISGYENYISNSLYVDTYYSLGDAYGEIVRRQDPINIVDISFDYRNQKYRRYYFQDVLNAYTGNGSPMIQLPATGPMGSTPEPIYSNGDYIDCLFSTDIYNVVIKSYGDNNVILNGIYNTSIKSQFQNNTITSINQSDLKNIVNNIIGYINNTICNKDLSSNFISTIESCTINGSMYSNAKSVSGVLGGFNNNIINGDFISNNIGTFNNNTVGSFSSNSIGAQFENNICGDYFNNNYIDEAFQYNNVSNYFSNNSIGNSLQYNSIGDSFNNNTVADNFRRNKISYGLGYTDFSSATKVYQDYDCTIFKNASGDFRLSYINNSDVIVYTNPNS